MEATKVQRTVRFFLCLLVLLNLFIRSKHRLIPLFDAALLINITAGYWYLRNIFYLPEEMRRYPIIRYTIVILLLLLNAIVFMGLYTSYQQAKAAFLPLSGSTPTLQWAAFDGSKHTLSEFKGHVAVLHFWASWCVPCRQEFPKLMAFAKAHPGVDILAIDVKDKQEKANRVLARLKGMDGGIPSNVTFAWDPDGDIGFEVFNIQTFPSSIFVSPKGQLLRMYIGLVEWGGEPILNFMKQWP